MSNWIDGVPSEPGVYWAELCDQGGWPFVQVLTTRAYYPKEYDFKAGQKEFDVACAEGISGIAAWSDKQEEVLELQYMIPHSSGIAQEWQPITSLWNCSKHIKIEQPLLVLDTTTTGG